MAERLTRIANKYGENAVHSYMGLGSQSTIWKSFWKKTFGTVNVFGNDSVCDAGRRTGGWAHHGRIATAARSGTHQSRTSVRRGFTWPARNTFGIRARCSRR